MEEYEELEIHEITCGNECGHWDELNQFCWLSWWHKQEGDRCNYGFVDVNGVTYTPKELEELQRRDEPCVC